MDRLADFGTILDDRLTITREVDEAGELRAVHVEGTVTCTDGVAVDVDKWLEARRNHRGQPEVKGYSYSYHARIGARPLLRYDSHHGLHRLHCHVFDPSTGELIREAPVSLNELPTLADFIEGAVLWARGERPPMLAGLV